MAVASSFAVLGDAYLAQDTAQEAFVIAWQKLEQLREPAAFPGWFKRIVLSQCNRLTRCRSEEHTSELQSRGLISYAVFCLKKKKKQHKPCVRTNNCITLTRE